MINNQMRDYYYYTFGDYNEYGQQSLSLEPVGVIKMAINITNQSIQDSILYQKATYIGLTANEDINESFIIQYGSMKLKVLYVNPMGRLNQVFMAVM